STATGGWRRAERPDAARARAEAAAPIAEISVRSPSGRAARRAGRRHDAWTARPRDAGDALCDRLARLGARRIEIGAGRLERRRRARDGQGEQGATRSARRRVGRMAATLSEASAAAPRGLVEA